MSIHTVVIDHNEDEFGEFRFSDFRHLNVVDTFYCGTGDMVKLLEAQVSTLRVENHGLKSYGVTTECLLDMRKLLLIAHINTINAQCAELRDCRSVDEVNKKYEAEMDFIYSLNERYKAGES